MFALPMMFTAGSSSPQEWTLLETRDFKTDGNVSEANGWTDNTAPSSPYVQFLPSTGMTVDSGAEYSYGFSNISPYTNQSLATKLEMYDVVMNPISSVRVDSYLGGCIQFYRDEDEGVVLGSSKYFDIPSTAYVEAEFSRVSTTTTLTVRIKNNADAFHSLSISFTDTEPTYRAEIRLVSYSSASVSVGKISRYTKAA